MRLRGWSSSCALRFGVRWIFAVSSVLMVPAGAQVVPVPVLPQVGSSNPVTPEPLVPRPTTTPCTVTLFQDLQFADYGTKAITYEPPAGCKGPWAKVVLTADFNVTTGRQFDRTAKFYLAGTNIYFGTTAEPRSALSPSWHIEKDVTDLSALFTRDRTGVASIQNVVNSTYTAIIYATAKLEFYPANPANPAPVVPTEIHSLAYNDTTSLNTPTDVQSQRFTLPRNIERVYLDVISQSQSADEFWYLCAPTAVAGELDTCGSTSFRETEVSIDGVPAGVAPVYPWIYTGGIDPYLWEPITGVETLDFRPYRVDLTPFAGLLSDGNQHTVGVRVFNADSRFDVASTLLIYTDKGSTETGGAVTMNTLAANPVPVVETALNTAADGTVSGPVNVRSARSWTISGYVMTSHGRVDTTIQASNSFTSLQDFTVENDVDRQNTTQQTDQQELVTTSSSAGSMQTQHDVSYPLLVTYKQGPTADGSGNEDVTTYVKQQKIEALRTPLGPNSPNPVVSQESVETIDTLHFGPGFATLLGHDGDSAKASYGAKDMFGRCLYRSVTSVGVVLTGVEDSASCSLAP